MKVFDGWETSTVCAHVGRWNFHSTCSTSRVYYCVCDWWPRWSVEMRCLGSGLPVVKLSCITTLYSVSEETVGVWDCKHTDEWRLMDHPMLGLKRQLFGYRHRSFCAKHQQASACVFKNLQQLCMEFNTAKNIFFFSIFGHFSVRISKQPKFRLKTKTMSKWWFFVFKWSLCTLLETFMYNAL